MKKSFIETVIVDYHKNKGLRKKIFSLSTDGIEDLEKFVSADLKSLKSDEEITGENLKKLCKILDERTDRIHLARRDYSRAKIKETNKAFTRIYEQLDNMVALYINKKKGVSSNLNDYLSYNLTDDEYLYVIESVEKYNNAKQETSIIDNPRACSFNKNGSDLTYLGLLYFYGEEDKRVEEEHGAYKSTTRFKQNIEKGLSLLEKAAKFDRNAGIIVAEEHLRSTNDPYKVIEPNYQKAIKFFKLAASVGNNEAKQTLDEFQKLRKNIAKGDPEAIQTMETKGGEEATLISMIRQTINS